MGWISFIGLALALGAGPQTTPGAGETAAKVGQETAGSPDIRAIWVVRDALTSPKKIQRVVQDAKAAGVTDLLVQVRGRGDAYYPSTLVPVAPQLTRAWNRSGVVFDPLAMILDQAHARGMRVHAWLNVYLVKGKAANPPGHVMESHPEWVAVNPRGQSMADMTFASLVASGTEGVFLSPGQTGVVRHFVSVVDEILSGYAIDGIHLDYCRYPQWEAGYGEAMRQGFKRLTGFDPMDLELREKELAGRLGSYKGLLDLKRQWLRFRADQVTALIKAVRGTMNDADPDLVFSVAVKPEAEAAYSRFGQDWVRWVREDLVDVVAPMMYSTSSKTVERQARQLVALVPPDRVWAGVSVYNQSLDSAASKIRSLQAEGIRGISIFSYNSVPEGNRGLRRLNQVR